MSILSYLINPSRHLWKKLLIRSRKQTIKKVCITEGRYNSGKGILGAEGLERLFLDMVLYCGCYYIAQQDMGIMHYALPIKAANFEEIQRNMRYSMASNLSQDDFRFVANSRFLAFWRMDSWLAAMSSMDLVTGTRIHGNMVALQSEVPAIPIVHDSRTLELCETMKIPYTTIKQAKEWSSPSQVLSQLETWKELSSEKLDQHRCEIAQKYLSNLLKMNLRPSKNIYHLALENSRSGSIVNDEQNEKYV